MEVDNSIETTNITNLNFVVTPQMIDREVYFQFCEKYVPKEFLNLFFQQTFDNIPRGIELLAIAQHESQWKYFRSKTNNDDTQDHGPLQLNSKNIANKSFMDKYTPQDKSLIKTDNDLYMAVCINYYIDITELTGGQIWKSLQVYNGGPWTQRVQRDHTLYRQTAKYADVVYRKIKTYRNAFDDFSLKNKVIVELKLRTYMLTYKNQIMSEMEKSMLQFQFNCILDKMQKHDIHDNAALKFANKYRGFREEDLLMYFNVDDITEITWYEPLFDVDFWDKVIV